ncbi:MAG TPA: copper chaperone PCu(A)C [Lysobacter sp.]
MRNALTLLFLGLAAYPTTTLAAPPSGCMPVVRGAWVRMTPVMPIGAGYFTIENPCGTAITLAGASSARFSDVSMHETRLENGISRMLPLPSQPVAPGQRVEFRPGGRHLMLAMPRAGSAVPTTHLRIDLRLADGRVLPVDFELRRAAP